MADGETLKEKYLNFLDLLREKGVPAPHVLVPLLIIIVIAAAIFVALPLFAPIKTQSITVSVRDVKGQPVANAMVTLAFVKNGSTFLVMPTGVTGQAKFESVPVDGSIEAVASATGFESNKAAIVEGDLAINLLAAQAVAAQTKQFSVKVSSSLGGPVDFAVVTLLFDDGSLLTQTTDASGAAVFELDEEHANAGHATVSVERQDYKTLEQSVGADAFTKGLIAFSTDPISLDTPDPVKPPQNGLFKVSVSSNGVPIASAKVSLLGVSSDIIAEQKTGGDGVAAFADLTLGTRIIIRVEKSGFQLYESADYLTFAVDGDLQKVSLKTKAAASTSFITLAVTDKEGNAIEGAEVNFFFKNSNKNANKVFSDSEGIAKFEAAKGVEFYATAFKTGLLPGFLQSINAGEERTIVLNEEVAGSTAAVIAKIVYNGAAAANARVSLFREDGTFLGIPVADADALGEVLFSVPTQFNGANYGVYAVAEYGPASARSDLLTLTSQTTDGQLNLSLVAPVANLTLRVVDIATNKPVPNAYTQILVANNPVDSCTTAKAGTCIFPIAADQPFTYSVTASGYLTYSSGEMSLPSAAKENATAKIYPLSAGLTMQFAGLFNSNGPVKEVANGEKYTAKFIVNIPFGSDQSGIYLRLGDAATAAEETAVITDFDSTGTTGIYSGATYDSALQCPSDVTVQSGEPLKWILLQLPKGFTGSKEISATITVRKDVSSTDKVNFAYRAYSMKNGTAFFSPSDASLASELLAKGSVGSANSSLPIGDLCRAKTASASIPVTQHPLICTEDGVICYKLYFESEARRGGDGFQATLGKDVVLNYEILSDYSIDSMTLSSEYFKVNSFTSPSTKFADESDASTALEKNVKTIPVNSRAGAKSVGSATMKALRSTQSGLLTINLASATAPELPQLSLSFSIVGTNNFKVSVSPQSLNSGEQRKLAVVVQDKLGLAATDASVELTECDGVPFAGNTPASLVGDGSAGAGEQGRYEFKVKPASIGTIGVRVSREDSRTFEQCLIPVVSQNFLSATPESLAFEGDSSKADKQQIVLHSLVPETIRGSASIDCFGSTKPIKVFPQTFTLRSGADATVTVQVIENITSNAQCVLHLNGRITSDTSTDLEVPIDVRVSCPNCEYYSSDGVTGVASLPTQVTLVIDPLYKRDSKTYNINLLRDPVGCTISGFRIDPYAQYQSGAGAVMPGGLGGLFGCQSCQMGGSPISFNCFYCMANMQASFMCQQCSQQLYPQNSFYCSGCTSYAGGMATNAWLGQTMPGAQWGVGGGVVAPGYGMPGQTGYGMTPYAGMGGGFATPYVQNYLQNGAAQYPYNYQYPTSLSQLDTAAYQDVVTAECTKDSITITADYHGRQPIPGTGSLVVSLGGGQKRSIPVSVLAGQGAIGMPGIGMPGMGYSPFVNGLPVPATMPAYYANNYACSIDNNYNFGPFDVDEREEFYFKKTIQYSCPYNFGLTKVTAASAGGITGGECTVSTPSGQTGTLIVECRFPAKMIEKMKPGENNAKMEFQLSSPSVPGASISGNLDIKFNKKPDASSDQLLAVETFPGQTPVCNIINKQETIERGLAQPIISMPGAATLKYKFPRGATEPKLFLVDNAGAVILQSPPQTDIFQITSDKFKAGETYSWVMSYVLKNEKQRVSCSFQVAPAGTSTVTTPGTPSTPSTPGTPTTPTTPGTPAAPKPRGSDAEAGTIADSTLCDTPSNHPIKNIVVYNLAKGSAVVRTENINNHFSDPNSAAKVFVCLRTDQSPDSSKVPKIAFVPNDASLGGKIDSFSNWAHGISWACNKVVVSGKNYITCETDSTPITQFGANAGGYYSVIVDASTLLDPKFPDYSGVKAVTQYTQRFYCRSWPIHKQAKSSIDSYGAADPAVGTKTDSSVYRVLKQDPGYACQNDKGNTPALYDRVVFGVGVTAPSTSGTTTVTPSGGSTGSGGSGTKCISPIPGSPCSAISSKPASNLGLEKEKMTEISFAPTPTPTPTVYSLNTVNVSYGVGGWILGSSWPKVTFYSQTGTTFTAGTSHLISSGSDSQVFQIDSLLRGNLLIEINNGWKIYYCVTGIDPKTQTFSLSSASYNAQPDCSSGDPFDGRASGYNAVLFPTSKAYNFPDTFSILDSSGAAIKQAVVSKVEFFYGNPASGWQPLPGLSIPGNYFGDSIAWPKCFDASGAGSPIPSELTVFRVNYVLPDGTASATEDIEHPIKVKCTGGCHTAKSYCANLGKAQTLYDFNLPDVSAKDVVSVELVDPTGKAKPILLTKTNNYAVDSKTNGKTGKIRVTYQATDSLTGGGYQIIEWVNGSISSGDKTLTYFESEAQLYNLSVWSSSKSPGPLNALKLSGTGSTPFKVYAVSGSSSTELKPNSAGAYVLPSSLKNMQIRIDFVIGAGKTVSGWLYAPVGASAAITGDKGKASYYGYGGSSVPIVDATKFIADSSATPDSCTGKPTTTIGYFKVDISKADLGAGGWTKVDFNAITGSGPSVTSIGSGTPSVAWGKPASISAAKGSTGKIQAVLTSSAGTTQNFWLVKSGSNYNWVAGSTGEKQAACFKFDTASAGIASSTFKITFEQGSQASPYQISALRFSVGSGVKLNTVSTHFYPVGGSPFTLKISGTNPVIVDFPDLITTKAAGEGKIGRFSMKYEFSGKTYEVWRTGPEGATGSGVTLDLKEASYYQIHSPTAAAAYTSSGCTKSVDTSAKTMTVNCNLINGRQQDIEGGYAATISTLTNGAKIAIVDKGDGSKLKCAASLDDDQTVDDLSTSWLYCFHPDTFDKGKNNRYVLIKAKFADPSGFSTGAPATAVKFEVNWLPQVSWLREVGWNVAEGSLGAAHSLKIERVDSGSLVYFNNEFFLKYSEFTHHGLMDDTYSFEVIGKNGEILDSELKLYRLNEYYWEDAYKPAEVNGKTYRFLVLKDYSSTTQANDKYSGSPLTLLISDKTFVCQPNADQDDCTN